MFRTNWIVITGSPSSGKTTIINKLAELGFQTSHEAARAHIEELKTAGTSAEEVKSHLRSAAGHKQILLKALGLEAKYSPFSQVIFDRGIPDQFAYYELNKHDANEAKQIANSHIATYRYKCVFFFEKLVFVDDGVRHESEEERNQLDNLFLHHYRSLGYTPIKVPVMPVQERLEFVTHVINDINKKEAIQRRLRFMFLSIKSTAPAIEERAELSNPISRL